jgi:hypothetical protein
LVSIHCFFTKLWPLDLEKYHSFSICLHIFIQYLVHCFDILSCRSSSSLVFIHLNFTKLWSMHLEKILQIETVFCILVVPLLALQSQIVRNQNLVLFCLNYFDWIYYGCGAWYCLQYSQNTCLHYYNRWITYICKYQF